MFSFNTIILIDNNYINYKYIKVKKSYNTCKNSVLAQPRVKKTFVLLCELKHFLKKAYTPLYRNTFKQCQTKHLNTTSGLVVNLYLLSLTLFMLWSFTNNHYSAFSSDYFAFFTDFFNRWSYFHNIYLH